MPYSFASWARARCATAVSAHPLLCSTRSLTHMLSLSCDLCAPAIRCVAKDAGRTAARTTLRGHIAHGQWCHRRNSALAESAAQSAQTRSHFIVQVAESEIVSESSTEAARALRRGARDYFPEGVRQAMWEANAKLRVEFGPHAKLHVHRLSQRCGVSGSVSDGPHRIHSRVSTGDEENARCETETSAEIGSECVMATMESVTVGAGGGGAEVGNDAPPKRDRCYYRASVTLRLHGIPIELATTKGRDAWQTIRQCLEQALYSDVEYTRAGSDGSDGQTRDSNINASYTCSSCSSSTPSSSLGNEAVGAALSSSPATPSASDAHNLHALLDELRPLCQQLHRVLRLSIKRPVGVRASAATAALCAFRGADAAIVAAAAAAKQNEEQNVSTPPKGIRDHEALCTTRADIRDSGGDHRGTNDDKDDDEDDEDDVDERALFVTDEGRLGNTTVECSSRASGSAAVSVVGACAGETQWRCRAYMGGSTSWAGGGGASSDEFIRHANHSTGSGAMRLACEGKGHSPRLALCDCLAHVRDVLQRELTSSATLAQPLREVVALLHTTARKRKTLRVVWGRDEAGSTRGTKNNETASDNGHARWQNDRSATHDSRNNHRQNGSHNNEHHRSAKRSDNEDGAHDDARGGDSSHVTNFHAGRYACRAVLHDVHGNTRTAGVHRQFTLVSAYTSVAQQIWRLEQPWHCLTHRCSFGLPAQPLLTQLRWQLEAMVCALATAMHLPPNAVAVVRVTAETAATTPDVNPSRTLSCSSHADSAARATSCIASVGSSKPQRGDTIYRGVVTVAEDEVIWRRVGLGRYRIELESYLSAVEYLLEHFPDYAPARVWQSVASAHRAMCDERKVSRVTSSHPDTAAHTSRTSSPVNGVPKDSMQPNTCAFTEDGSSSSSSSINGGNSHSSSENEAKQTRQDCYDNAFTVSEDGTNTLTEDAPAMSMSPTSTVWTAMPFANTLALRRALTRHDSFDVCQQHRGRWNCYALLGTLTAHYLGCYYQTHYRYDSTADLWWATLTICDGRASEWVLVERSACKKGEAWRRACLAALRDNFVPQYRAAVAQHPDVDLTGDTALKSSRYRALPREKLIGHMGNLFEVLHTFAGEDLGWHELRLRHRNVAGPHASSYAQWVVELEASVAATTTTTKAKAASCTSTDHTYPLSSSPDCALRAGSALNGSDGHSNPCKASTTAMERRVVAVSPAHSQLRHARRVLIYQLARRYFPAELATYQSLGRDDGQDPVTSDPTARPTQWYRPNEESSFIEQLFALLERQHPSMAPLTWSVRFDSVNRMDILSTHDLAHDKDNTRDGESNTQGGCSYSPDNHSTAEMSHRAVRSDAVYETEDDEDEYYDPADEEEDYAEAVEALLRRCHTRAHKHNRSTTAPSSAQTPPLSKRQAVLSQYEKDAASLDELQEKHSDVEDVVRAEPDQAARWARRLRRPLRGRYMAEVFGQDGRIRLAAVHHDGVSTYVSTTASSSDGTATAASTATFALKEGGSGECGPVGALMMVLRVVTRQLGSRDAETLWGEYETHGMPAVTSSRELAMYLFESFLGRGCPIHKQASAPAMGGMTSTENYSIEGVSAFGGCGGAGVAREKGSRAATIKLCTTNGSDSKNYSRPGSADAHTYIDGESSNAHSSSYVDDVPGTVCATVSSQVRWASVPVGDYWVSTVSLASFVSTPSGCAPQHSTSSTPGGAAAAAAASHLSLCRAIASTKRGSAEDAIKLAARMSFPHMLRHVARHDVASATWAVSILSDYVMEHLPEDVVREVQKRLRRAAAAALQQQQQHRPYAHLLRPLTLLLRCVRRDFGRARRLDIRQSRRSLSSVNVLPANSISDIDSDRSRSHGTACSIRSGEDGCSVPNVIEDGVQFQCHVYLQQCRELVGKGTTQRVGYGVGVTADAALDRAAVAALNTLFPDDLKQTAHCFSIT